MKVIKGASGWGDAIYLRGIVEWLLYNRPDNYMVLTSHPDIYLDLPVQTDVLRSKIYQNQVDYTCTYLHTKGKRTIQWNDMLLKAQLPLFPLTTKLKNRKLTETVIIIPTYPPHNGAPNSSPMRPNEKEFQNYISQFKNVKFIEHHYKFLDLVEIFNSASLIVGQIGWSTALAEILDIPVDVIFTRKAINGDHVFISDVTPTKILTKHTSKAIIME